MMINNEVLKPDDATLVVRRLLKATPDLAFAAWTSEEHIREWMRPEPGIEVPYASMDVRVGGKFRIQMKMPDGDFCTAVGVFREVAPPERLVYTWDWEKDGSGEVFGEVEGNTLLITVDFLRRGENTEFILTHTRFATVESRDNHARGWERAAGSFAAFLEKE